ncbi:CaiB/BaiF CoA transferase family protein [Brevibacterium jeotgali]|uniref:Formyl-CoA transferase n=1 Tax=Brevibacterium jeotgali TaxID=1262550 RepID=A0A2H1L8U5_9MICO|nr:CaiB/BaiF CoA-transferase family protein [Brevibacterium jeotgali]TWC03220.1 formyl-CoA transferase [Brevibacterium jeotgali]SMY13318.1 formyl-CoA transferase [Brevibacterium jeotgali]
MEQVLNGIRVIDAGSILAAPGASALLADFGAEVIKVEPPGTGDSLRGYSPQLNGDSLTFQVTNRGKKSVTLDLRQPEGRDQLFELVKISDVIVLNFRVSTVEKWGIGYEALKAVNPKIIVLHLTGYGLTGPYRDRPGFARVAEAYLGLTYTTGYADRPPVPSGYAIADAMGGVYGAFSVTLALLERKQSGEGQLIDLALYELLAKTLDGMYVGALHTGKIPERSGTSNPTIAPHDIYPMGDGVFVSIPASTQSMFERLCDILSLAELKEDPRFLDNQSRVKHREELDEYLRMKFAAMNSVDFLERAHEAQIAANAINNPLEFTKDPHVIARDFFEEIENPGRPSVKMQGVVPKLSRTPGSIRHAGESLGASNEYVYENLLRMKDEKLAELKEKGVI